MKINFIDHAVEIGKRSVSKTTGFLHYHHEKEVDPKESIPLFENFAFALALFRTRNVDNIELAVDLVSRLICFQNHEGLFPVYIHEFPNVNYNSNSDILIVLFWIQKEFSKLLEPKIKERLKAAIKKMVVALDDKSSLFKQCTYFKFQVVRAALLKEKVDISSFDFESINSKESIKDALLALQVMDLENKSEMALKIWNHIFRFYSYNLFAYIGPPVDLFQNGFWPELSLADLFLIFYFKQFEDFIINREDPIFLLGGIVRPLLNLPKMPIFLEPETFENRSWHGVIGPDYSFIAMKNSNEPIDRKFRGYHLFRILLSQNSSLVCQDYDALLSSKIDKHELVLMFELSQTIKSDEFELQFYLENNLGQVFVEDVKATSFKMKEKLTIYHNKKRALDLTFSIVEGSGVFTGHILRSNRPSQLIKKDKTQAFDYSISLRTLKRSERCKIEARILF